MSNSHSKNYETKESEKEFEEFKSLSSRQATCKLCGLTARNESELEDHVRHAHKITR